MNSQLLSRVEALERRNYEKDANKAWETSWTRRLLIVCMTYLLLGAYMSFIGVPNPFLSAAVPAVGFLLSTLTMSLFKKFWLKFIYRK